MRYPNLRYGNPFEFEYYTRGVPLADVARRLRRDERTIRNYLNRTEKLPWWIPELLRLKHMEHVDRMRQMGVPARLRAQWSASLYALPSNPGQRRQRLTMIDARGPAANASSFALSLA